MRYTRLIAMFCCILITFCSGISMSPQREAELIHRPRVDLRSYIESLSPEECIVFLEENHVAIPDFCMTKDTLHYAKGMFLDILDDPHAHHFVGRAQVLEFSSSVDIMLKWYKSAGHFPTVSVYVR